MSSGQDVRGRVRIRGWPRRGVSRLLHEWKRPSLTGTMAGARRAHPSQKAPVRTGGNHRGDPTPRRPPVQPPGAPGELTPGSLSSGPWDTPRCRSSRHRWTVAWGSRSVKTIGRPPSRNTASLPRSLAKGRSNLPDARQGLPRSRRACAAWWVLGRDPEGAATTTVCAAGGARYPATIAVCVRHGV